MSKKYIKLKVKENKNGELKIRLKGNDLHPAYVLLKVAYEYVEKDEEQLLEIQKYITEQEK